MFCKVFLQLEPVTELLVALVAGEHFAFAALDSLMAPETVKPFVLAAASRADMLAGAHGQVSTVSTARAEFLLDESSFDGVATVAKAFPTTIHHVRFYPVIIYKKKLTNCKQMLKLKTCLLTKLCIYLYPIFLQ